MGADEGRRRGPEGRRQGQDLDERNQELDAKTAASDADWPEADAVDALDYAAWTVSNAWLAVLDVIDARHYADEQAKRAASQSRPWQRARRR